MRKLVLISGALLAAAALHTTAEKAPDAHPRYPSPTEIRVSKDGRKLYVICEGTDEVLVVDARTHTVEARIPVGRVPRDLVLSADEQRAYVTNSWGDTVSEIELRTRRVVRSIKTGYEPQAIVSSVDGKYLYTANRLTDDISVIDLSAGKDVRRLAAAHGSNFLSVSHDGKHVYGTHIYPIFGKFRTQPKSEITVVDVERNVVEARYPLLGMAGVFRSATSNDGRFTVAVGLRPKNLIPLAHVEHGWAFVDTLAVFGDGIQDVVQLPLDEMDRYTAQPYGVAISPDNKTIFVSASGSDEIEVIDVASLLKVARTAGAMSLAEKLDVAGQYLTAHIKVGVNPKGITLSPDGKTLYVANRLDDTISVIDTKSRRVSATLSLGGTGALTAERKGQQLFNTARFSFQGSFGCANCHLDATFDALSWDLEPDGFGIDIVDNRPLEEVADTAPFKWNGQNPDLQTECGPRTEKFFFRSQSFNHDELEDLVAYVKSIPARPNRYRLPNDEMTPAQERGRAIFERTTRRNGTEIPVELQCTTCHSGDHYTSKELTNIGSKRWNDRSPMVDVPQLTNVVNSAPYMHDGAANTLEEIWTVFNPQDTHGVTNDLQKDELNDLIEYLKTL